MYDYWRFGSQEFPVLSSGERDLTTTTFAAPAIPMFSGEADILGGIRSPHDLIEINLETVIESDEEFTSLRLLVGTKDMLYRRRTGDSKFEVIMARLSAISPAKITNISSTVKVKMTFIAYIPVWVEFEDLPWYFDTGKFFDDGLYFDQCSYVEITVDSQPKAFIIDNTDSEIASGGQIVLHPSTGSITGFTLSTYDRSFKFDDELASYNPLYLDLDKRTVYEGAHSGYNASVITGGWLEIPEGEETYYVINYDALEQPATFYWFWRRQYL